LSPEDGGDSGAQSADAPVGVDVAASDGPGGPDSTTGDGAASDDANDGADGAREGAESDDAADGTVPDVASEAAGSDGANEATTVPDGSSDAAMPDGSTDSTVLDGPTDAPVADAAADGTGPDGGATDSGGTADSASGDADGGMVLDATAADAPGDAAPFDATGDVLTDAPSDASADVALPDGAGCSQPSSDAQASCSSLCNNAPVLPVTYSTQAPPAATGGGAPPAGVYYATGVVYYFPADAGVEAGASSETLQETAILASAGVLYTNESVLSQNGGPQQTDNFQIVHSGTDLYLTQTCPNPGQLAIPYSSASNTFTVYIPGGVGTGSYTAGVTLTLQTPSEAGAPLDAGLPDAGTCSQPLDDAQASCSPICNAASPVSAIGVAGSPPAATGGTIADGTYYLTSRGVYLGADGGTDGGTLYTVQETVVLSTSNGITFLQDIQNNNGQPNGAGTASLVASGNTVYLTELCPNTAQKPVPYTASGNTFIFYDTDGPNGAAQESVFTKQ
jgi:hypothetical protein